MPALAAFDWETFAILAALTLWDGPRRVPEGAWVLRQVASYPWEAAGGPGTPPGRLLLSYSPFAVRCVVTEPGQPGAGQMPSARAVRGWTLLLRLCGLLSMAALLVGVPLLTPSYGTYGLALALGTAFALSVLAACVSLLALRRMGVDGRTAMKTVLPMLSPFTAPQAPEIVLQRVLEAVPFARAVRVLRPGAFAQWVRPLAYDHLRSPEPAAGFPLTAGEAAALVAAPPADVEAGERYCPRCGSVYLPSAAGCRTCAGVALATAGDEPSAPELTHVAATPNPVPPSPPRRRRRGRSARRK
ncbi:MAG TPA: hypothetical protein VFQ45_10980 [Longimicrobium sp.]|nr:hypothetical protein [Longimicrobium sp.]